MTDETQTSPTVEKTKRVAEEQVLRGGLVKNYGVPITAGAVLVALLEFLGGKPEQSFKLLAQFGPRWVFFTVLIVLVWDLSKRLLKLAGRAVAHIGELAANTGRAADGVQAFAAKSDRTAEEQQRLTAFAVQNSQRAVELSAEGLAETKKNGELLQKIAEKQLLQTQVVRGA